MLLLECIAIALLLGAPWIAGVFRRWVLLPIHAHRDDTLPYESRSQPGGREHLTAEAREQFDLLLPQFHAEGFDEVSYFVTRSTLHAHVTAVQAFLVNRRDRQMASVVAGSHTSSSIRNFVVSIGCLFEDVSSICTSTRRGDRLFPGDPRDDRVVANWIRDVHTLCEFHRRRLAASRKAGLPRVLPPPGGEHDFLCGEWARARNRYLADGIVYLDPDAGLLRLTWRGAYLLAWRACEPVRQWRENREANRASRVWHDLDMNRYVPPVAIPPPPDLPADDEHAIAPAEPGPSLLRYEMVLAPDEIAEEHLPPDTLAVRMGMPGKLHYLHGRWPALLWIACLAAATVYWIYTRQGALPRLRSAPPLERLRQALLPAATVFALVFTTGKLALQVLAVRGMILLTASPRGLTYRNVPFLTGRGAVARSNVRALLVLPYPDAARRDLHTLFLITHDGVRLPLLITPDRPRLESLRARIAQTMGIDPAAKTVEVTAIA